jgi:hypothetical protein
MDTSLALSYYSVGTAENIYWPMSTVSWAYPKDELGNNDRLNDHDYPAVQFNKESAKEKIRYYMEEAGVSAENTVAVIEYATKPFFGSETTYDVALYQAKEGASITDAMWSYKKTPASKDTNLMRVATVTIVADNKTNEVLNFELVPVG